jgi:hypothetical protein
VSLPSYPPDTKEKEEKVGAFFQKHSPPSVAEKVPAYLEAAKKKYPSVKSWGIVGVSIPSQRQQSASVSCVY